MRNLALVLMVIFHASGCGPGQNPELTSTEEIQRMARMKIPLTATNNRCASETGRDQLTYGRFDLPVKDLGLILAQMPANAKMKPFEGYSNVTSHNMQESWWKPDLLKNPRTAAWSEPGFSWNLLFGESTEPEMVTVYFFNFTL